MTPTRAVAAQPGGRRRRRTKDLKELGRPLDESETGYKLPARPSGVGCLGTGPKGGGQASEAARRGLRPVIPAPARPGSGRSSPRRRSRRCPRCGTRFQEWKSACSLRQGPAGLRTDRAAAALHARLRRSARPRCLTRQFGGGGELGSEVEGWWDVRSRARHPRHAGNCSLKSKSRLPGLGAPR